jgi:hypothetical protein
LAGDTTIWWFFALAAEGLVYSGGGP